MGYAEIPAAPMSGLIFPPNFPLVKEHQSAFIAVNGHNKRAYT